MADERSVLYEGNAHGACAELRFAEGLRRGWEEARAEAALQEAVLLAWMEGARGSVAELREASLSEAPWSVGASTEAVADPESSDAGLALTLGIWNAAWQVESSLPPLNAATNTRPPRVVAPKPIPAVLAGINRDVCAVMVSRGQLDSALVAIPTKPAVIQRVMALVAGPGSGSAITQASEVLRLLLVERPFEFGNGPTAFLFVKWLLATRGVEPTGVAVLSLYGSQNQQKLSTIMQVGAESTDGWQEFLCESIVEGCRAGQRIALSVQAGVTLENLGS